jgi:cell division septal protein FtsQ
VQGNTTVPKEEILSVVSAELAGTYGFLVPRNNVLVYPHNAIEDALLRSFGRLRQVHIDRLNLNTITVSVTEREPFALWCGEEIGTDASEESCYFLDEHGIIFAPSPHFTGNVFFKYYGKAEEKPVGTQYMTEDRFRALNFFLKSLEEVGYSPGILVYRDETNLEIRFENGTKIFFDSSVNLGTLLNDMQSVLSAEALIPENGKNLEYVDFRFGNKVYYKFITIE